ncbi:MAG: mercuric reductase, partial [Okeania sp. SIO2H7]|nr:mercuric reductase [Okeania sp. SIO2H7]
KVEAIADLPYIWPTLGEMNGETSAAWLQQGRDNNPWLQDLIENLFHWRRSWL